MVDHWKHSGPPAYIAIAGYLGLIKDRKDESKTEEYGDLEDLVSMFGGNGGMIQ